MPRQIMTDDDVRAAAQRIAGGEFQRAVAAAYGISHRGLRLRLVALGLGARPPSRLTLPRARHCPSCSCVQRGDR